MRVGLLLGLGCLLCTCGQAPDEERHAGTIEFPDVEVGSLVGGRVTRVLRREGDRVAAGDCLVELDTAEWQSHLDEARSLAASSERELALLEAGPRREDVEAARASAKRAELLWRVAALGARPEELAAAREEVKAAQASLEEAQKELDRLTGLVRRKVEPPSKLDAYQALRDTARAKHAVAEQHLELLQSGLRPEEIEATRQAWVALDQRRRADLIPHVIPLLGLGIGLSGIVALRFRKYTE